MASTFDSPSDYGPPLFADLYFHLSGFDAQTEDQLKGALEQHGGAYVDLQDPSCTHVIVSRTLLLDDPVCVAAKKEGKFLVTEIWVSDCLNLGIIEDANHVIYRPLPESEGIAGSKKLVVCLTGYQGQARRNVMRMVQLMGANFSKPLIANKVTHLICYKFEGEKYNLAQQLGLKLVNHCWLEDCLKEWTLMPEEDYKMSGHELELLEVEAKDSEDDGTKLLDAKEVSCAEPAGKAPANNEDDGMHQDKEQGVVMVHGTDVANANLEKVSASVDPQHSIIQTEDVGITSKSPMQNEQSDATKSPTEFKKLSPHTGSLSRGRAHNNKLSRSTSRFFEESKNSKNSKLPVECAEILPTSTNLSGDKSASPDGDDRPESERAEVESTSKLQVNVTYADGATTKSPAMAEPVSITPVSQGQPKSKRKRENKLSSKKSVDDDVTTQNNGTRSSIHESNGMNADAGDSIADRLQPDANNESDRETLEEAHSDEKQTSRQKSTVNSRSRGKVKPSDKKHDVTDTVIYPISLNGSVQTLEPKEKGDCLSSETRTITPSGRQNGLKVREKQSSGKKSIGNRSRGKGKQNQTVEDKELTNGDSSILSLEKNEAVIQGSVSPSANNEEVKSKQKQVSGKTASNVRSRGKDLNKNKLAESRNTDAVKDGYPNNVVPSHEDKQHQEEQSSLPDATDSSLKSGMARPQTVQEATNSGNIDSSKKSKEIKGQDSKNKSLANCQTNTEVCDIAVKETNVSREPERRNLLEALNKNETIAQDTGHHEKHDDEPVVKKSKLKNVKRPTILPKKPVSKKKEKPKTVLSDATLSDKENVADDQCSGSKNKRKTSDDVFVGSKSHQTSSTNNISKPSNQRCFALSGHRHETKPLQALVKKLGGKLCRDSHQWSHQTTHLVIAGQQLRRTEKFFAAAAAGRWILRADYLNDSGDAGKFLDEVGYEWHGSGMTEEGSISYEAPRKWRELREKTGCCALEGLRIILYGECIIPSLDTLRRAIRAGGAELLATSPPYTRFVSSGVDFAIVSPGTPRSDEWIQEFLTNNIACVTTDFIVDFVCKPSSSLDRHILYDTHEAVEKMMGRLKENQMGLKLVPKSLNVDDQLVSKGEEICCAVCGKSDRGDVMLLCGDEKGSGCGCAMHINCCEPPLDEVPSCDWYCMECTKPQGLQKNKKKKTVSQKV